MSISNKALLVNLSISQWAAKRIDKQATNTVEVSHKTQSRVGNFTKKLIFGDELDNIHTLAGNIRTWFYQNTLPWATDGSRMLKNSNYFEFTETWRAKQNEFETLKQAFLNAYPTLRENARQKLGELFQESEYPDQNNLENSFSCSLTFMPVPDISDFRVDLSDFEKKTFLDTMRRVETEALTECWTRLKEVVSKATNKLSDPGAVFRNSLIDNVQEMCSLLPKLNVMDDPNLESMRREVEKLILNISADRCRENNTARQDAAAKLADIEAKMSAFMGA